MFFSLHFAISFFAEFLSQFGILSLHFAIFSKISVKKECTISEETLQTLLDLTVTLKPIISCYCAGVMARISSSSYMCVLVLTLGFLVFEIVVGRICRSLLIAVDSFHTLYIFINLTLSAIKHHSSSPSSPDPSTTAGPSRPDVSSGGLSPPYAADYRRMRLKPFGVLISALLMASQCVSISLEILTHLVQPEPIQHPLLSIVVGGTSLIFNVLVLAWKRGSSRGIGEATDGISKSLMRNNPDSTSERKGVFE